MTRGMAIVAALLLVGISAGVGCALAAGSRGQGRVQSTRLLIKETERDLVRARMHTGEYPRQLAPAPLDAWGRPIVLDVPGRAGQPYQLTSYGADGVPGGTGRDADIVNWEI